MAAAGVAAVASIASAQAVRGGGLFTSSTLAANDDGSTGLVAMGATWNFFGTSYSNLYVNNNGNVTFDGPLGTYTPFPIVSTATKMIAPFFADVDTRGGGLEVKYGTGTVGGRHAFGVNWVDVGYYSGHSVPTNSFQLVMIDRADRGAGDFDFEFNYDRILWETGDASGGSGGLGGSCARTGFSNGSTTSYELPGSGSCGALLDGGPAGTALIHNRRASSVDGRYIFSVESGVPDAVVPEPSSIILLGSGLVGVGFAAFRRRREGR